MRIADALISTSEENVSGYRLFRISAVLRIDAGSAVGQGRVHCRTASRGERSRKDPREPRLLPALEQRRRPAETGFPEEVVVEFNSHGTDLARVEFDDALETLRQPSRASWSSWPPYKQALQEWQWGASRRQAEQQAARTGLCLDLGAATDAADREHRLLHRRPPRAPRRRSRRPSRLGPELGRGDEQLRPSSIPLPTLFSFGLAGALAIRRGSAARTSPPRPRPRGPAAARPPRPRRRAGSPASGRGPWRRPRSGSS